MKLLNLFGWVGLSEAQTQLPFGLAKTGTLGTINGFVFDSRQIEQP